MFWFCLCHFIFPLFFLATYVGSEFATIGCLLSLLLSTAPAQPLWCNCLSSIRLRSSSCKRLPQHGGMYGVSSFLVFFLSSFLPFSFYNLGNVSFFLKLLFCFHVRWYSLLKWSSLITDIQTNQQRKRKSVNSVVCCMVGSTRSGNNSRPGMNLGLIRVRSLWL